MAKKLANKYHKDIYINTVIGEKIVDYESPDEEIETEQSKHSASELEQNEIPQEVKEAVEKVIRPAINSVYKVTDELIESFSKFGKSCITIHLARPPTTENSKQLENIAKRGDKMNCNLSKNTKSLREIRGMTQEELADKADVSRSTIAKLESGWKIPSFATVMLIAEALGG